MQYEFNTDKYKGVTDEEAAERIRTFGFNELPSSSKKSLLAIAVGVIKEPMFILLVGSGMLYLILGDIHEGLLLLAFVFLIMGIEFHQERKTEHALNALRDLSCPMAHVIRSGIPKKIPGREIVPGDLFVLKEGDRVPADARVISCINLSVDESLLTGESVPVHKTEFVGLDTPRSNDVESTTDIFSGSLVVQGHGIFEASATGIHTQIGKIGQSIDAITEEQTRLTQEISRLVTRVAFIGIILCAVLVAIFVYTRGGILNGLLAGITLAMSILPEEIPVILAVFMAIGAYRMSAHNVLTRKTSTIEALGSATVLCTDKTGTLTRNRMQVSMLFDGKNCYDPSSMEKLPETFQEILTCGMLSSQIHPFDPMEKAIECMCCRKVHDDWHLIREYPLTRDLLVISRACINKNINQRIVASKGAPEDIFDICHLNDHQKSIYSRTAEEFASKGLRVLGVAKNKLPDGNLPENPHDLDFSIVGLIGLSDPVRENVRNSVSECHKGGIRVIMITGDYPVTAVNIAREIGLENPGDVITGHDLQTMNDDELSQRIRTVNVFARVVPDQKLKIVNALKMNNEIVAMTGDGVNDAPALKAADIGISMGQKGTDVARESSDLVLMDDNFSSIVSAVRMGRRIFDNLQKALAYTFAIHVPITGIALIPVFSKNLPLVLWPAHVVFLEMIIDPACSIIFEAEPEESNVMNRPPKSIDEPFFGKGKVLMSCVQGLFILAAVMGVYFFCIHSGYPENKIRSMSFVSLIVANIATILSNRTWTGSIFKSLTHPTPPVKWVLGGAVVFLTIVLNTPFFLNVFRFEKISLVEGLFCIIAGLTSIIWFECYKVIKFRR